MSINIRVMKNKNFIFWFLQLIFDISILIALMWHDCFNKYADNRAYSIYTEARTYTIMEKPAETYDYIKATDNIKKIYVKYVGDKIVCKIIGWNGQQVVLKFNRSEHVHIDYL